MTEAPAGVWKSRALVMGVFLAFFLPILMSWYLVFFTGYKHGGGAEHGKLIVPARQLVDTDLLDPASDQGSRLHGKWTLISIEPGICDEHCANNLYRMRQIRYATGKEMQRLQNVSYFLDRQSAQQSEDVLRGYEGHLMMLQNNSSGLPAEFTLPDMPFDRGLFLVDPAGFLMMYYPAQTEPSGIIKDLKRLLRISKLE